MTSRPHLVAVTSVLPDMPSQAAPVLQEPPELLPETKYSAGAWRLGQLFIDALGPPVTTRHPKVVVGKALSGQKIEVVCYRSLFIFSLDGWFRKRVLEIVANSIFDKFILSLIMLNSILLAAYDYRSDDNGSGFNWVANTVIDPILTGFFTLEFVLKVIAFGFFLDQKSYLRDAWNWLDFVVVVTANITYIPGVTTDGLGFLRMFRILRPLRSLNAVPQMKVLVQTVLCSIPRLGNVSIMGAFLFGTFGIIGISLLDGVSYHGCRVTENPVLVGSNGTECWSWLLTGDDRLCGGTYMCQEPADEGVARGFCGGHEAEENDALRPKFEGGRRDFPWCPDSGPKKLFPSSDFIHFDHFGGALLTIFQCMTVEGWTDVMYMMQDGYGYWISTIYFFVLIPVTSFFLLNIALAVIDEARGDFADEAHQEEVIRLESERSSLSLGVGRAEAPLLHKQKTTMSLALGDATLSATPKGNVIGRWVDRATEEATKAMEVALGDEEEDALIQEALWCDFCVVRLLRVVATSTIFTSFIMLCIAGNVVIMMMDAYTPNVGLQDPVAILENVFLAVFSFEMA
ncbi:unnamed protein product, partial [Polarella glacialis]